ncbi:MAG: dephospho-CoA kinase [bacterium]|nr:dephospho-CoA kinase [bacterium]
MLKVGITGNIGSGKSTLVRIFAQLGVPVYDADSRAKGVMVENKKLVSDITQLLGTNSYFPNGDLNRGEISQKVFNNPALLKQLNALVHPALFLDFDHWVLNQNAPYVLKEAALLIESGSNKKLDQLIVVLADEGVRLQRSMDRDKVDEAAILARMRNQMPQEEKANHAQFIIHNNSELLIPQVLKIHQSLLFLAKNDEI